MITEQKKICHRDIAKAMNINQSTVSRALDPTRCHMVSKATREKVEAMVEEMGFRPNIHARRVRTSRSEAITLVIDDITNSEIRFPDFNAHSAKLMLSMTQGVIDGATENEYDVKLLPLHSCQPVEQEFMMNRIGFPYSDGVIFHGFHYMTKVYEVIRKLNVPCLCMHGGLNRIGSMPVVETDLRPGFREAAKILTEKGHKNIAYATVAEPANGPRPERYAIYKEIMSEVGLGEYCQTVITPDAIALRRRAEEYAQKRDFTAIICFNDAVADLWRRELEYLGIVAGRDVSIIGCDANPAYEGLASIRVPLYDMGKNAAAILVNAIKNKQKELTDCIFPSSLQLGKSL